MTTTARQDPRDAKTTLVEVTLPQCDECPDRQRCARTVKVQQRCAKAKKK